MLNNSRPYKVEAIRLMHPLHMYPQRLSRFMQLMTRVRALHPGDAHLWQIMDSPSFQDVETALTVALINHRIDGAQYKSGTAE